MRRWFMLACLVAGGSSFAAGSGGARVRWRGVNVDGHGPAQLQSAAAAHVAVALRQLGSTLTVTAPADAEAQASCLFVGNKHVARCLVEVSGAGKSRAQRRAEIPYRDAEDLAESLSLLVSDVLTAEFPDVLAPRGAPKAVAPETPPAPIPPQPLPPTPTTPPPIVNEHPTVTPPPRPQDEDEDAVQKRLAAERARQEQLAHKADRQEAAEREAAARVRRPSLPPPERLSLDAAGTVIVGFGADNPSLYGGAARVLWGRGLLRLGGTLSLAGVDQTLDGHALGFFRAALAARAGVGVSGGAVDFDATAGPALVVLATDAHDDGRHAIASFALVIGPRLSFRLAGSLALVIGLDVTVAVTDEKVTLGPTTVADFSRAVAEITLGLSWSRPTLRRAPTVNPQDPP